MRYRLAKWHYSCLTVNINIIEMKNLRSILVITALLTLSFTAFSSFIKADQSTATEKAQDLKIAQAHATKKLANDPLHGDVWFAFSAIGFIGAYLAFKK